MVFSLFNVITILTSTFQKGLGGVKGLIFTTKPTDLLLTSLVTSHFA